MKRIAAFFLLILSVPAFGNVRITVDSTSLDFGGMAVGGSKQLVLHATTTDSVDVQIDKISPVGQDAGDFRVITPGTFPTVVVHGHATSITVRFSPSALGRRIAKLSIETTDGIIFVPMSGAGEGEVSQVALSTTSIDFGTLSLGGWKDSTIELYSIGRDSATISGLQVSNANGDTTFEAWFAKSSRTLPFKLAPGDSIAIVVQFNGISIGPVTGAVIVFGGTGATPVCALNGDVQLGLLEFQPPIVDFGPLSWGELRDTTVRLANIGEVDVVVTDVEPLDDAEFTLLPSLPVPFTVRAGASRDIVIRALPAAGQRHSTSLQLGSPGQFHYLNLSLTADGSMPLSAPSHGVLRYTCAFPGPQGVTVPVDDTGAHSFTITGISATDTAVHVESDSALPITIAAGEQHRLIGVHFDPASAGGSGQVILQFASGGGVVLRDTIRLDGIPSQAAGELFLTSLPTTARGTMDVRTADMLTSFALDTLVVHVHSSDENVVTIDKSSINLAPGLSTAKIFLILHEAGGYAVWIASPTPLTSPAGSSLVTFEVQRYVSLLDTAAVTLSVESPERGSCLGWFGDAAQVPAANVCGTDLLLLRDVMNGTQIILTATLIQNPISNGTAEISIKSSVSADVTYDLSTALGQVLHRETGHLEAGSNDVRLPLSGLPSGVYYVRILTGAAHVHSLRMIKQD